MPGDGSSPPVVIGASKGLREEDDDTNDDDTKDDGTKDEEEAES